MGLPRMDKWEALEGTPFVDRCSHRGMYPHMPMSGSLGSTIFAGDVAEFRVPIANVVRVGY
jgi:hypothetical protein